MSGPACRPAHNYYVAFLGVLEGPFIGHRLATGSHNREDIALLQTRRDQFIQLQPEVLTRV